MNHAICTAHTARTASTASTSAISIVISILISTVLVLSSAVAAAGYTDSDKYAAGKDMGGPEGGLDIEFMTVPEEPQNFQPFFTENRPAKVIVMVKDAEGNFVENVNINMEIEHVKGPVSGKILHTGFPYLEGKKTMAGSFTAPDGRLEFNYVFPIRGEYRVVIEALPAGSSVQFKSVTPVTKEFRVHVREQGFEVRNAVILSVLLLVFGIAIGVVYGRASLAGSAGGSR